MAISNENVYIASDNIWIFPCANRTRNLESKLNTEANFTNIPSAAGVESYVFPNQDNTNDAYVRFSIGGYYVKITKDSINTYIGKSGANLYAHLILINKNLLTNSTSEELGGENVTQVIGSYASSGEVSLTSDLDAGASFHGIIFNSTNTLDTQAAEGVKYTVKTLQLINNGAFTNVAPIDTAHIKDAAVTTIKIADSNITTDKINDSAVTTAKINNNAITKEKLGSDLIGTSEATKNGITVKLTQTNTSANRQFNIGIASTEVTKANTATNVNLAAVSNDHWDSSDFNTDTVSINAGNGNVAKFKINNVANANEAAKTRGTLNAQRKNKSGQILQTTSFNGSESKNIDAATVGAATFDHTHGNINNDGTFDKTNGTTTTANADLGLVVTKQSDGNKIKTLNLSVTDPTPETFNPNEHKAFVTSVTQNAFGQIVPKRAKLSKGTISVTGKNKNSDTWATAKTLFTENSNNNVIMAYDITTKNNLDTKPTVIVTQENGVCKLTFDGIMGHGLEIKESAQKCTKVGDCYIEQNESSTNFRKLMILTESSPKTFTDGGYIQGPEGFGIDKVEKIKTSGTVDTYKLTMSRTNPNGGGREEKYFEYTVTNGSSGVGYCDSSATAVTKVVNYPEFKFSSSTGKTPVTADNGRHIIFYLANTNTVKDLKLKTTNTSELAIKVNGIAATAANTWFLEKGLYKAEVVQDTTNNTYYWNLSLLQLQNLTSTIGQCTPSSSNTAVTCSLPGFILNDASCILMYVTQNAVYNNPNLTITLNVNNTGAYVMQMANGTEPIPYLATGYYKCTFSKLSTSTNPRWILAPINLQHQISSGVNAAGNEIISPTASDTTITLGNSGATAGMFGPLTDQTLAYNGSFTVPQIYVNNKGIVAHTGNRTITLPSYEPAAAYCKTAGATAAKTAVHNNYSKVTGFELVTFKNTNTAQQQLTLSINGKTAGTIYINGAVSGSSNYNIPAGTYLVYCDGSKYYLYTNGDLMAHSLQCTNNLTVDGTLYCGGNISSGQGLSGSTLTTTGNATIGNNLTVNNAATISGDTTIKGDLHLKKTGGLTTSNGIYFSDGEYTYIREANLANTDKDDELRMYTRSGMNFVTSTDSTKSIKFACARDTETAPIYFVPYNGYGYAKSWKTTSDKRLKTNIIDYQPKNSILDLAIKKFDFIDGPKEQIGCLAQDLQKICPEIVNEGDGGYLAIEESKIVYLLLDEVKKLRKEVNELKKDKKKKN